MSLIALSITLVMISTLTEVRELNPDAMRWTQYRNLTEGRLAYFLGHSRPRTFFIILEGVVLVFKYPHGGVRCRFFCQFLNLADLLGIFPTYIMLLLFFIESRPTSGPSSALRTVSGVADSCGTRSCC